MRGLYCSSVGLYYSINKMLTQTPFREREEIGLIVAPMHESLKMMRMQ